MRRGNWGMRRRWGGWPGMYGGYGRWGGWGWRRRMGCFPCCSLVLALPLLAIIGAFAFMAVRYI